MSLMKNIIAVILIVGVMVGCSDSNSQGQKEGITISGTVLNPASGIITVDKMLRDRAEPIDTIYVENDNTYNYVFTGPAGYYRVNFFNTQASTIILDQDTVPGKTSAVGPVGLGLLMLLLPGLRRRRD
jgi:MYXO-CTERM domain-containing protein